MLVFNGNADIWNFCRIICTHFGRCGLHHMVVGFTTALCYQCLSPIFSLNPAHGQVYSIQCFMIKFVNDLQQVGGFLRVLRFPPPIKLCHDITEISLRTITLASRLELNTNCMYNQVGLCLSTNYVCIAMWASG